MKLSEIRSRVLDNLDSLEDSQGDLWVPDGNDYTRLDGLINDAYHELVLSAENLDPLLTTRWPGASVRSAVVSFTGASGFLIEGDLPDGFRRAVSVMHLSTSTFSPVMLVVDFERAQDYLNVDEERVCYVRRTFDDKWKLGISRLNLAEEETVAYAVNYIGHPVDLGNASDEPEPPAEFHYLIVLGATVRALTQENSDARGFASLYEQGLARMLGSLPKRPGVLSSAEG